MITDAWEGIELFLGDPTNWWAPTASCVEAMVRSAGLSVEGRPGHELWLCRLEDQTRWGVQHARKELRAVTGRDLCQDGPRP